MKIVFINCYFNHHQKPFSDALIQRGADYTFLETMPMPASRRALGYQNVERPAYVRSWLDEPAVCEALIDAADVVLFSSAPEKLLRRCFGKGKVLFRVTERPMKRAGEWKKFLPRLLRWRWRNPFWAQIYLLSASAYAPGDYASFGLFRGRAYCWGYFPPCRSVQDVHSVLRGKKRRSILWVGRFLDWKHPDDALRAAAALRRAGYDFTLELIGTGPMEAELQTMTEQLGLTDCVRFLGAMPPEQVRSAMEQAEIFLFTSDRREGWGAVLNEAMNSACAVVASAAAGATPYLVEPGKNGLVYPAGDVNALSEAIQTLLDDPALCGSMGAAAYETITTLWNADTAAERFLSLAEQLRCGGQKPALYASGPCSPAQLIREDWYDEA